jgi:aspartate/methionine/tyrosine aminotransferase
MFSQRLSWSFSSNRLAGLLQEKAEAGEEILDLTESNPTRAGLDYPADEILASLSHPESLVYQPTPHGLSAAREAIARYYAGRGQEVAPDALTLTASTSEAYSFLFKVLGDPGDRILVPRPSYPLFDYLATLESLEVDSYPLAYLGSWNIDLETMRDAVGPRTRALLIVHPNNPTGSFVKRGERAAILELCRERGFALIVDEVFFDFPADEDPERAPSFTADPDVLTFVLSGLSKVVGLPQMKLSWIWTGGPQELVGRARARLEQVSDLFLSVGAPVQHAANRLLDLAPSLQRTISSRLASNERFLQQALAGPSALQALHREGGWYSVLRCPAVRTSEDWAVTLLSSDNLYLHPGYLYDFPAEAYLVVSLLTPPEIFQEGIRRLARRVEAIARAEPD